MNVNAKTIHANKFPNNRGDGETIHARWIFDPELHSVRRGGESNPLLLSLSLSLSRGHGCIAMPLLIRFRLGKDLSTLPWLVEERGGRRDATSWQEPLRWLSRCARARCNVPTNAKLDA